MYVYACNLDFVDLLGDFRGCIEVWGKFRSNCKCKQSNTLHNMFVCIVVGLSIYVM